MPPSPSQASFEAADGTPLHAWHWAPAHPRAVVVLVHGLFEHAGRYGGLVDALLGRGYAVAAYDQRGHGRSGGARGMLPSVDALLDDLAFFLARVRPRHPGLPCVLFGHSMGGMVAAVYAVERAADGDLDALVLSAPYLGSPAASTPVVRLAQILGTIAPRLPTRRIDAADLSHDPAVVEDYRRDPLTYGGRIPARTGATLLDGARRARGGAAALPGPLLILQGGADRLTPPETARRLYAEAGARDKTLAFYAPLYHEVLNEPPPAHAATDLLAWIEDRM